MDTLLQDLKYAVRTLRRTPAFTLAAVACLALGIGANTAIFSVIDGVLLRRLPFQGPSSLVMVWETNRGQGRDRNVVSPANYLDWRAQNSTFSDIGSYIDWRGNLTGDRRARRGCGVDRHCVVLPASSAFGTRAGTRVFRRGGRA